MAESIWCEHCREHFTQDHYDSDGNHRVGSEYGPVGGWMARERPCVHSMLVEDCLSCLNGLIWRLQRENETLRTVVRQAYAVLGPDVPPGLEPGAEAEWEEALRLLGVLEPGDVSALDE